jgi:hypothetical protein
MVFLLSVFGATDDRSAPAFRSLHCRLGPRFQSLLFRPYGRRAVSNALPYGKAFLVQLHYTDLLP